jgi:hypothetical protein
MGFKIRNEKDVCKNEPAINFKTANTDSGQRNRPAWKAKANQMYSQDLGTLGSARTLASSKTDDRSPVAYS